MKLYHKAFLYKNRLIQPYLMFLLKLADIITYLASGALIGGVIYEHGFRITFETMDYLNALYKAVWIVFLITTTAHLFLEQKEQRKKYRSLTWITNALLYLTLVPVIFFKPESGPILHVWEFLNSKGYHVVLLLLLSFFYLSNGTVRLLGKRTNPSLILATSFFFIILIGSGLLMLPRCTFQGISWIDAKPSIPCFSSNV